MSAIDLIQVFKDLKLPDETNAYTQAVRKGIIPLKINHYYELFNYFTVRSVVNKTKTNTIELSEQETAIKFNCSEMTVHRAIKFMRE